MINITKAQGIKCPNVRCPNKQNKANQNIVYLTHSKQICPIHIFVNYYKIELSNNSGKLYFIIISYWF